MGAQTPSVKISKLLRKYFKKKTLASTKIIFSVLLCVLSANIMMSIIYLDVNMMAVCAILEDYFRPPPIPLTKLILLNLYKTVVGNGKLLM